MTYYDLATNLFLQIALIMITCRLVVFVGKRYLGQTEVVCEMLAGMILGPSVFGLLLPELQQNLFPAAALTLIDGSKIPNPSMTLLFVLSQIGVVLYMFLTGLDFSLDIIKKQSKTLSVVVSSGVIIPFIMGAVLIYFVDRSQLIVAGVPVGIAMIYFGAAVSITAFPVLARILDEKGLLKTSLGKLALASGSLEDAIAWGMIALILTITQHNLLLICLMLGGTIFYVVFMISMSSFLQKHVSNHFSEAQTPSRESVVFILILLMICAVAVDKIGLYSAFGAFVAGMVMPKGTFAAHLNAKFSYLTTVFLLPIFFAYAGLNTHISLINTPELWLITLLIIVVSLASKLVTCTLAAHYMGVKWRESLAFGVLMNTRGLMELVILNIGLQHHIISLTLYSMMVIMTLITTFMTSPLVSYILDVKEKRVAVSAS